MLISPLISPRVWGTACSFNSDGRIPVVYFGGYKSTDAQAIQLANAFQSNSMFNKQLSFEGNSLHGAKSNEASVLSSSDSDIKNCVAKINSADFKGPIGLMGHSDGAWVINQIVRLTKKENRKKIKLINLDGYASVGPEFEDVDVQCWTSYSKELQPKAPMSCSDIGEKAASLYTHEMKKCKPGSCRMTAQSGCNSNWCLHFRMINANANGITRDNYASQGYASVNPPAIYFSTLLKAASSGSGGVSARD